MHQIQKWPFTFVNVARKLKILLLYVFLPYCQVCPTDWWMVTNVRGLTTKVNLYYEKKVICPKRKKNMSRRSSFLLKESYLHFLYQSLHLSLYSSIYMIWYKLKKKGSLWLSSLGIPSSHTTSRFLRTWLQADQIKAALR